jgi:hypothetical protein
MFTHALILIVLGLHIYRMLIILDRYKKDKNGITVTRKGLDKMLKDVEKKSEGNITSKNWEHFDIKYPKGMWFNMF